VASGSSVPSYRLFLRRHPLGVLLRDQSLDTPGEHGDPLLAGLCGRIRPIESVMAGNESSSGRSHPNPERPLRLLRSGEIDRSLFGRFNSLIVDFVSLFFGFISLFGPVGNSHSGPSKYQWLAGAGSIAGQHGIVVFVVSFRRPGNSCPADFNPTPAP
jgi:hypothetical protein